MEEPDLAEVDEALYENQYLPWCHANGVWPTLKGYYLFIEEHYD